MLTLPNSEAAGRVPETVERALRELSASEGFRVGGSWLGLRSSRSASDPVGGISSPVMMPLWSLLGGPWSLLGIPQGGQTATERVMKNNLYVVVL